MKKTFFITLLALMMSAGCNTATAQQQDNEKQRTERAKLRTDKERQRTTRE